jgi:hypothetical protein
MQPYATLDLRCLTSSSSLCSAKVIQAYSRSFKAIQALKKIVIFFPAPKCQLRRASRGVVPLAGRRRVAAGPHLASLPPFFHTLFNTYSRLLTLINAYSSPPPPRGILGKDGEWMTNASGKEKVLSSRDLSNLVRPSPTFFEKNLSPAPRLRPGQNRITLVEASMSDGKQGWKNNL